MSLVNNNCSVLETTRETDIDSVDVFPCSFLCIGADVYSCIYRFVL